MGLTTGSDTSTKEGVHYETRKDILDSRENPQYILPSKERTQSEEHLFGYSPEFIWPEETGGD